jgi:hypothetical protein
VTVAGEDADFPQDGVGFIHVEPGDFYGTGSPGFPGKTYLMMTGSWGVSPEDSLKTPDYASAQDAVLDKPEMIGGPIGTHKI